MSTLLYEMFPLWNGGKSLEYSEKFSLISFQQLGEGNEGLNKSYFENFEFDPEP